MDLGIMNCKGGDTMADTKIKEIEDRLNRIELYIQTLEERVDKLEKGEFGTGVYLDGCTEADAEYITGKPIQKAGE